MFNPRRIAATSSKDRTEAVVGAAWLTAHIGAKREGLPVTEDGKPMIIWRAKPSAPGSAA
jgi:hypothetical protein